MIQTVFKKTCNIICDLLYPPCCQICTKTLRAWPTEILCPLCLDQITFNKPPFCLKCCRYLGEDISHPLCTICRRKPLYFDFAWSACLYTSPLKELIHHFKFHDKTYYRFLFAPLLIQFIDRYQLDIKQFDYLMPVPLSPTRQRERGYNQSLLLASDLAKHYGLPVDHTILIKHRHTHPQTQLSQKIRFTNLEGAFKMKSQINLVGKNILLVDDLLTTGSTASEIARLLKSNGAGRVGVLTLATTV